MKKIVYPTLEEDLEERLKNPKFRKAWAESEAEYLLACKMIEKRQKMNLSQRDLAQKVKTSQARISHIESMQANPSLFMMKRIASALDMQLVIDMK